MSAHFDSPFVVFALALIAQGLAAYVGDVLRKRAHAFKQGERHDFNTVQAATFTLLALIIGFTFSMAVFLGRGNLPLPDGALLLRAGAAVAFAVFAQHSS